MVAEAEICHQSIPVLDVQLRCSISKEIDFEKIEEIAEIASDSVSEDISASELVRYLFVWVFFFRKIGTCCLG